MISVTIERFLPVIVILALASIPLSETALAREQPNPKLAELIKKAAAEGEIVFQGSNPATGLPTHQFLRDIQAVTQKHFGVSISIRIDSRLNYPAATAKTLTEIKTGAPPTFDLMTQTLFSGAPLYKEKAIEPFPWLELFPFISRGDLEYKGSVPVFRTGFMQPAYNTKLVKPQDVPRRWKDNLDPKWKGNIGLVTVPGPWVRLAAPNVWGEEKTFDHLKKLMQLNPMLGRFPAVHQRVVSGETPLAWGQHRERTLYAKEQLGAPVDTADQVEPPILYVYVYLIPRGARHPNAAALVAAAMLTKEGQDLQRKYQNGSSLYRPGTPAAKFAAKRKLVKADIDFILEKGVALSKKVRGFLVGRR
jgi:ABC-type Fe3+ transport system substrate-binding protein